MKTLKKTLAVLLSLAMVFGTMTVTAFADDNEAKIGSKEYATLKDAMLAARDGDEIELLKDVTVADRIELAAKAVTSAYEFTLNAAGKTVTYTGTKQGFLLVRSYITVTIKGDGQFVNVGDVVEEKSSEYYFSTNQNSKVVVESGTFTGTVLGISYTSFPVTIALKGGTWNVDPAVQMTTGSSPKEYSAVAAGYMAVPNDPDAPTSWGIELDPSVKPVVELDGVNYYSFNEALDAVNAASTEKTIKVLEDFETDTLGELKDGKKLVLDLNGKVITCTAQIDGTSDYGLRLTKSELTLDDTSDGKAGKIVGTGGVGNNGFIYVNNTGATFTMNAGTIEANGSSEEKGVVWTSGSKSAKIIINGGVIKNINEDNPSIGVTSSYTPSVEIYGGEFFGFFNIGTASSFSISGGLFHFNPEDTGATIAGGLVDNEDGTWTVIPKDFATLTANGEEVGSYTTFNAAVMAGYNNYTDDDSVVITLIDDAETAGGMDLSTKAIKEGTSWTYNAPDFTIDLNGKTLTVTGEQLFKLKAKMTIDDFSAEKNGQINFTSTASNSNGFFYINGGRSFNVNNGTISAPSLNSGKYLICSSGFINEVNVYGGKIESGAGASIRTGSSNCTVTVSGGTILGEFDISSTGKAVVNGGTFNFDPSQYVDASVYIVEEDVPDYGLYTVTIDPSLPDIVSYGGTNYKTVTEAAQAILATADKKGTIKFLSDATIVEGTINIDSADADITFDLDGHTIIENKPAQMFYLRNGSFALKNGTILSAGAISTSGQIRINNGSLLVSNITFDGDKNQAGNLTNVNSKNGGAFYIYGANVTFENSTIKNCQVKDNNAGTGNSGAIHIVKQNVETVANVILDNTTITNCQAAIQGGGVSVGSGCTLTIDTDSKITNCSSAIGGAVYVDIADSDNFPAKTDFLCGKAVFNGTISDQTTGSASTGEDTKAPVASNGFVYEEESNLKTEEDVFQRQSVGSIDEINLTLKSDLDMGVFFTYAAKTGEKEAPKMRVAIEGEKEKYLEAEVKNGNGELAIEGITMAMMANKIDLQIGNGDGIFFSNPVTTSVVDYAERANAQDPGYPGLKNLLADMLKLGSETQKYWGTGKAFDVANTTLAPYVTDKVPTAADSVKATTVSATDPDNFKIMQAAVNIFDKINCFFYIKATDPLATVTIKTCGNEEAFNVSDLTSVPGLDNIYRLNTDRFSPTQYGEEITVALYSQDGEILHAIKYSVNSYCFSEKDSAVSSLVLAIFRAGESASYQSPV